MYHACGVSLINHHHTMYLNTCVHVLDKCHVLKQASRLYLPDRIAMSNCPVGVWKIAKSNCPVGVWKIAKSNCPVGVWKIAKSNCPVVVWKIAKSNCPVGVLKP